jgi:DNA-binding transcriptional LysR family regulator
MKDGSRVASPLRFRQHIIRHLLFFVTVAQEENLHRAASRANVTQSALSRHILALEQELGTTLFKRTAKGVSLTPTGKKFYTDAQELLLRVDRSIDRLRAAARGEEGLIRVGFNEGAARSNQVMSGLQRFSGEYPNVHIELYSMVTDQQREALNNESIDIGFFYEFQSESEFDKTLEKRFLREDKMVLALTRSHPLARASDISLSDLRNEKLIWPSQLQGPRVSNRMISIFHAAGVFPKIVVEIVSPETTINFVLHNIGVGFVPESLRVPNEIILKHVRDFHLPLDLYAGWREKNIVAPIARKLMSSIMAVSDGETVDSSNLRRRRK